MGYNPWGHKESNMTEYTEHVGSKMAKIEFELRFVWIHVHKIWDMQSEKSNSERCENDFSHFFRSHA